jgi:photosystem II stability/assembly factor-like uncharacterized protein
MVALLDNGDCPVEGGRLFFMTDPATGWLSGATGAEDGCEAVSAVAFSPAYAHDSLIFAATNRPPTILRSLDTGRSWKAAETTFPEGTTFAALLPSPKYADDQMIFARTAAGLVYRSRDGGLAWQLLDQRLDHLALVDTPGPALDLVGIKDGRLLRSADDGNTWVETGATPNNENLTLLAAAPATENGPILYAFTETGRFARSVDSGLTWSTVLEVSPAPVQLAIAAEQPEEERPVFLLHNRQVIASYDGMASVWSATAADEANRFRPTAMAVSPDFPAAPYLVIGTSDGQIIRVRADALP